ncbi:MAG: hypothetical protein P1U56_06665 [Saprospiraceae bacterium]|nr:hypothetical protein [Saprospiraceae bacterium]
MFQWVKEYKDENGFVQDTEKINAPKAFDYFSYAYISLGCSTVQGSNLVFVFSSDNGK